jgi:DNA polymerase III epsilon subunit-like protein
MKDSKSFKYIVIDFEGKNENIREFSFLIVKRGIIDTVKEFVEPDSKMIEHEINALSDFGFDALVSHNAHVEKNFLNYISPYQIKDRKLQKWGPWLDTYNVYKQLYPNLKNYDLKSLTEKFVNQDTLNGLSEKHCNELNTKYHFATFDCICTYLLLQRLEGRINLQMFLRW